MTTTFTPQLLDIPLATRSVPTVAASISQSSHHSRKLEILLATKRSPTAMSGRTKQMLKIAYIFGAWLARVSGGPAIGAAMLSKDWLKHRGEATSG